MIRNNQEINYNNNNNINELALGDIFLGDSMEIEKLFDNNPRNNNNNFNYNFENDNNEFINPILRDGFNINNNNNDNSSKNMRDRQLADSIYKLTDAQVLEKREREMRALEREQEEKEKKNEEEKRKREEEENRIKKINNNYEMESEIAKMILPEEPSENDPDVCHIIFRPPDGEKTIERRFLKTDKISILYDYVKSIGREIFMEPDASDFDILCSGFPPKNLETKKNNTLEEEGMFPNSILQIREK